MGCDIHGFVERRDTPGADTWHSAQDDIDFPFDWRSYGLFGFLADVRNYSHCPTVTGEDELRGLPDGSAPLSAPTKWAPTYREELLEDSDYHSHHWVRLDELLNFNYDQVFEDLRYSRQTGPYSWHGAAVATPGDGNGTFVSVRDFLGTGFFDALEELKTIGQPQDVRVVMWFDN